MGVGGSKHTVFSWKKLLEIFRDEPFLNKLITTYIYLEECEVPICMNPYSSPINNFNQIS